MNLIKKILQDIWVELATYLMIGIVALVAYLSGIFFPEYSGTFVIISIPVVLYIFFRR